MNQKIWESAAIDFAITALAGFLSWPEHDDISVRSVVVLLAGAAFATLKGIKTYYATHPSKLEVAR